MSGQTGLGTILKKGASPIGKIQSISGPSMTRETIDATVLDNTGNGFREFITGLRDGGTLSFDMQFTKAGYNSIKTDFMSDEVVAYSIELPDSPSTKINFNGLVTDFPLDIPLNDIMKCSVSVKITGGISVV